MRIVLNTFAMVFLTHAAVSHAAVFILMEGTGADARIDTIEDLYIGATDQWYDLTFHHNRKFAENGSIFRTDFTPAFPRAKTTLVP